MLTFQYFRNSIRTSSSGDRITSTRLILGDPGRGFWHTVNRLTLPNERRARGPAPQLTGSAGYLPLTRDGRPPRSIPDHFAGSVLVVRVVSRRVQVSWAADPSEFSADSCSSLRKGAPRPRCTPGTSSCMTRGSGQTAVSLPYRRAGALILRVFFGAGVRLNLLFLTSS